MNNFEEREQLSKQIGSYWASFARDGIPSKMNGEEVHWPRWETNGGSLLKLDGRNDGGISIIKGRESLELIIKDLKTDSRIKKEDRCDIGLFLKRTLPDLKEKINKLLECI